MKDKDGNEIEIELDFDVILTEIGSNRMEVMKAVRALNPLDPMTPEQTKQALESLPFIAIRSIDAWSAMEIAGQLKKLGAAAKIEPSKEQSTYEYYMGKKYSGNG